MIKPSPKTPRARQILRRVFVEASEHLRSTLSTLEAAAGTFYNDWGDWSDPAQAKREHYERINCLRGVLTEIESLAKHTSDPVDPTVKAIADWLRRDSDAGSVAFKIADQIERGEWKP